MHCILWVIFHIFFKLTWMIRMPKVLNTYENILLLVCSWCSMRANFPSWGIVLQVASYLFHNVVYVLPCSGCVALLWYVQLSVCIALLWMCWGSFLKWLEHGPITPAPVFVVGMEWKGKSVSGEFWAFLTHYLIQWEEDVRICLFCLLVFLCSFKRNLGLCEEQCSALCKSRSWWSATAPNLLLLLT
jgi:hypothetical protein